MHQGDRRYRLIIPLTRIEIDLSSPVEKAGKSTLMTRGFISSTISKRPALKTMSAPICIDTIGGSI